MLDTDTKRRIDNARDILVGKLPDPKSQVEQITIALIYKFMDDMDKQSEELGGKSKFFSGEYKKYAWSKIFDPRVSGIELVNLYGEAIQRMNHNPNIPQLFRDIFKNAYLPYRDPETLKSFLKAINDFQYDHSERLGDAFEYLLSVLGSQGEAGQFRTPRHIIDFMVEIVDPAKTETILDPACGTAGFLISSYKHILKRNSKNYDPENDRKAFELHGVNLEEITINNKKYRGEKLTSDDKERLANNVLGYDISPDMVRLSLVNMYLHGFSHPRIYEYDTLTSEDKWNEFADVILANPPFMSPYGGIKPHKRFSVESKRSEVLFVDYIAEHLTPQGRSCVIVPEGIIFQTQTAYKNLRKMLIEKNYLVGVVSLPAGVFNPYSNVKTSILWIDKNLAKKTNKILFVKIANDGFDLGAQRRPIKENDMPDAFSVIQRYKKALETGIGFNAGSQKNILTIEKQEVARDGDFIFSIEHYKPTQTFIDNQYPMVAIGEVAEFLRGPFGSSIKKSVCVPKGKSTYKVYEQGNVIQRDFERGEYYVTENKFKELEKFELLPGDIVVTCAGTLGKIAVVPKGIEKGIINSVLMRIRVDEVKILKEYFVLLFSSPEIQNRIIDKSTGVAVKNMFATSELKKFPIPLPPLVVQEKIIAEMKTKQVAIDHARELIGNLEREREYFGEIFKTLKCEWAKLEDVCNFEYGYTDKANEIGDARFVRITDIDNNGKIRQGDKKYVSLTDESRKYLLRANDILIARTGATYGKTAIFKESYPAVFASYLIRLSFKDDKVLPEFYWLFAQSAVYWDQAKKLMTGGGQPQFNANAIKNIMIPLVSVEMQKELIEQAEKERSVIDANNHLIEMFEQKIKDRIIKVWKSN